MLPALIHSFLLQRTQAAAFPSQVFTMKQSLLAHLVLAVARKKKEAALCKLPIQFSLIFRGIDLYMHAHEYPYSNCKAIEHASIMIQSRHPFL